MAKSPVRKYATAAPATADIISGEIEAIVRSSINTSRVNITPAIGALNIPAIAPDAPQPTSSIRVFWSSLRYLPKFDPIAAPVSTIGASGPTEPPKPIVSELATIDDHVL